MTPPARRNRGTTLRPVATVLAVLTLVACGAPPTPAGDAGSPHPSLVATATPSQVATAAPAAALSARDAQVQLAALPVKGRAPLTGYTRDQFGPAWADVDHNGCDTRNDILRRDLTAVTVDPATHGCVVQSGTLHDPYSGTDIAFVGGETTSAAVQIDHVVALGDAWQTGAQQLDLARRTAFANDPANLLAVDGRLNEQKGDGDAATWLPPAVGYRCAYVARQVAVKTAYGLWVTPAEHDAIARILGACPGAEAAPTVSPTTAPTTGPTTSPTTPPTTASTTPPTTAPTDVYYADCAAARAAGAAPILRGQPGYRPGLDLDGDGVACET